MLLKDAINHLEEELKIKEDWSCVACKEEHEQLLSWLKELQAIKEAKPSEALESLEKVKGYRTGGIISFEVFLEETEEYNTLKQALLKAQEQEKVLNIITKKNIDIFELKISKKVEEYNAVVKRPFDTLTQEEFKLLKEYFKYEYERQRISE